jgi:hypothetical protein
MSFLVRMSRLTVLFSPMIELYHARSENEKAEDIVISENVSGNVERSGIEPLTSTMPSLRSTN